MYVNKYYVFIVYGIAQNILVKYLKQLSLISTKKNTTEVSVKKLAKFYAIIDYIKFHSSGLRCKTLGCKCTFGETSNTVLK